MEVLLEAASAEASHARGKRRKLFDRLCERIEESLG